MQRRKTPCMTVHDQLWTWIKNFDIGSIDHIILQGGDINKPNSEGQTPLGYLVSWGRMDYLKLLIERGADVCRKSKDGKTPLFIAAEKGDLRIVKILIENGARPTIQTAFLEAIESENLDVIKYLKEEGALVNWTYKNGKTPLKESIQGGDFAIVKYLLENGADPKLVSEDNKHYFLMQNVTKKDAKMVENLLNLGVNVETRAYSGDTALTKATSLGDFRMVRLLVQNGASVNRSRKDGRTALSLAAELNHFQIATILIDAGADIKQAQPEVERYAEWNEDFDIFLKLFQKKCSVSVAGSEHEEAGSL